ncbi:MAG: SLC13 family permease [Hyphomicrobiaceae bacterium]
MTSGQIAIIVILVVMMGLFIWGRWRHDLVALAALLATIAAGLVPAKDAFQGFGHPAVITVACVLVLSSALQATGAIDAIARHILPEKAGPAVAIGALSGFAALMSGFMNNIGALALLMPLALQTARRLQMPAGRLLMPLAFASILGGMTTLIGTPPNLIVSGFRAETGAGGFAMFDFTPVGLAVALAGLAFIVVGGWRLVPRRERRGVEGFEIGAYLTEAHVPEGSSAAGKSLREIEAALESTDAQVVGLVRNDRRIPAPNPFREVRAGDVLVIEADPEALSKALASLGLALEEDVRPDEKEVERQEAAAASTGEGASEEDVAAPGAVMRSLQSDEVTLMELAVRPRADLVGHSARDLRLRGRFGLNLLAISREGQRSIRRLRQTRFREGDVLLMQGTPEAILDFAHRMGCIPLAERPLRLPDARKAAIASAVLGSAIAAAALGLVPAAVAFAAGVLAVVLLGVLPARRLYDAVDWPVIVLLGALFPVAGAMASTGAADVVAKALMAGVAHGSPVVALTVILLVTMFLSDFMNNAATAAVMCPIAIGIAGQLGANADAFLMAVAIGASCAFLTPIGHQNNTLIMGPGGFRFSDYWRLGVPIEIVVLVVAVPLLLVVWPL